MTRDPQYSLRLTIVVILSSWRLCLIPRRRAPVGDEGVIEGDAPPMCAAISAAHDVPDGVVVHKWRQRLPIASQGQGCGAEDVQIGVVMRHGHHDWVQCARAVPIEQKIERRGIKLRREGPERVGPCPKCGGEDRFAINTKKI